MSHFLIFDRDCATSGVTTYAGLRHRQTSGEAAKDYRRGWASPNGASETHVSDGLEIFMRLAVKRSGTARRFNCYQSPSDYVFVLHGARLRASVYSFTPMWRTQGLARCRLAPHQEDAALSGLS